MGFVVMLAEWDLPVWEKTQGQYFVAQAVELATLVEYSQIGSSSCYFVACLFD